MLYFSFLFSLRSAFFLTFARCFVFILSYAYPSPSLLVNVLSIFVSDLHPSSHLHTPRQDAFYLAYLILAFELARYTPFVSVQHHQPHLHSYAICTVVLCWNKTCSSIHAIFSFPLIWFESIILYLHILPATCADLLQTVPIAFTSLLPQPFSLKVYNKSALKI